MANKSTTCHMTNKQRLIDANALNWGRCPTDGKLAKAWLDEAPTVDAVEVVHGRWERYIVEEEDVHYYTCSVCNYMAIPRYNYCPNCGVKMDGDGNEKP